MASLSFIRSRANQLGAMSQNQAVAELASLVSQLASHCEAIEKMAKDATADAKRAKNMARSR